jgi:hypothetical protein
VAQAQARNITYFRKGENGAEIVVQTVPLDPPVAKEFNSIQTKQADEGVGSDPGVCPTVKANWAISGKTK